MGKILGLSKTPLNHMNSPFGSPLIDSLECGVVVLDREARVCQWNSWLAHHTFINEEQVLGISMQLAFQGAIDPRVGFVVRDALDLGMSSLLSHALHPSPFPIFAERDSTERIKQAVRISPLYSSDGRRWCLIIINDITSTVQRENLLREQARRLSEKVEHLTDTQEQLRHSEARFKELARQAPVGIFETSIAGDMLYANEFWLVLTGCTLDDCRGKDWVSFVALEDAERARHLWHQAAQSRTRFSGEFRFNTRLPKFPAHKVWMRIDITPVRDQPGQIAGFIGTVVDIHEAKEIALRDARQAMYDSLTDLYNRAHFNALFEKALISARQLQRQLVVLFMDLDNFKPINDQFGHEAGDEVLKAVGRRLLRALRQDDVVARFGGDEFVALLNDVRSPTDIDLIKKKIQRAFGQPINIRSRHVNVTVSIGVAVYPEHGRNISRLLHHADSEMYAVKQAGRIKFTEGDRGVG